MIFEFDDFELDDQFFELRHNERPLAVQPKVLKLILYLVQHRGRVVTKEELSHVLWRATKVGDSSLTRAARNARRALNDSGDSQRVIRTVRGVGYRFCLPVRERQGLPRSAVPQHPAMAQDSLFIAGEPVPSSAAE